MYGHRMAGPAPPPPPGSRPTTAPVEPGQSLEMWAYKLLSDDPFCHTSSNGGPPYWCGATESGPPSHGTHYLRDEFCPGCGKPHCPECSRILAERLGKGGG